VLSLPFSKGSLVYETTLVRRSNVLSLHLQQGFPGFGSYLKEEVKCTEPSPSIRVPWFLKLP
jgi:hypothetical protein